MSSTFKQAIQMASKLPEQDQEALGAMLIREMESERRWAELFRDSQDLLAKLADEALSGLPKQDLRKPLQAQPGDSPT